MPGSLRLHSWGAGCGFASAVLLVFWVGLAHVPDAVDAPNHILTVYADSGARAQINVSIFVMSLAGICFLGFLADLHGALRAAAGSAGRLPTLALLGGVGYVVLLVVAAALLAVLPNLIAFDEVSTSLDADLAATIVQLGLLLMFVFALAAASTLVLATSIIGLRTGLLPTWLGRAGQVLAALLLVGFFGPPFFLLLLWVGMVSVIGRPRRNAEASQDGVLP